MQKFQHSAISSQHSANTKSTGKSAGATQETQEEVTNVATVKS